uniref:HeH/LEM domain-containing protein n=1 Tax=viral metagenome TaxID=1070528 RepID=A0A6C0AY05_9ZZZZ|tara:strand:+ start:5046 stop:5711 length:666 start_codon:yes stop_codon:yes gene_type:complete
MEPLTLFGLGTNIMFSLGIVFAIVFIIFYMRQRFSDYNHKLNSMFQLISAMADELNGLKGRTNVTVTKEDNSQDNSQDNINDTNELMKLIVSDDSGSESEEDSDSDDSDNESNTDNLDTINYNNIVLNSNSEPSELNINTINNNLEQVVLEEVTQDIATGNTNKDEIKLIELIVPSEENEDTDVNKMTVKQLKDLLTQKGLIFEQSAKKKDLIKILEESNN